MNQPSPDAGSYRDFRGHVFPVGDRILRTVMPAGVDDFDFARRTGLIDELIDAGHLIAETQIDKAELGDSGRAAAYLLEHPKLPYVSYPYEWTFSQLQAAALLHLDVQLAALDRGVTLTDASAYNIQFRGARPVFIDSLSFCRYRDGDYWTGHRQFCEQFLNPLLLRAKLGLPHNAWFRGTLDGIAAEDLARILKLRHKFSWQVFTNVVLQARLQGASRSGDAALQRAEARKLPKIGLQQMLHSMRRWLSRLEPRDGRKSVWGDYAQDNSYASEEARAKRDFVSKFTRDLKPTLLFDIGCNTGDYSIAALENGATRVVGFDFDHGALEHAFARARDNQLDFLPLHLDAGNPSPDMGWQQNERKGFGQRANADAVIALAFVHHLAIARNIPLAQLIRWITDIAPLGIIEFVQKSDPMVQQLLRLRPDHFADYNQDAFETYLREHAEVVATETVSASGRTLYRFRRRDR